MAKDNKSDQNEWFSIGEAAKYLRVSPDTLRRWEKCGYLKAHRSPTNHRYYLKNELENFFTKKGEVLSDSSRSFSPQEVKLPAKKENLAPLVSISLFIAYIIIAGFLAWLLLSS